MAKAIWRGTEIASGEDTIIVEGNHYFPPESVRKEYLEESSYRTTCPWKGEAHYFNLLVDGEKNENAAWSYLEPKEKAGKIKDHVAFWKGVSVV